MLDYRITDTGYRITMNGRDIFVQEDEYSTVFPGETMEERALNHIAILTQEPAEE